MRPIPVVFHIGALQVHTYGIGLALTFYFGYRYFAKRLVDRGYPDTWLGVTFVIIIVSAIIGARVFHVVANLSDYQSDPLQVFAIWNGGLSSFGGLAFAIPLGLWSAHRRCPELRPAQAGDIVAPVLAAAWAMGRLLGPQLMVAGGGKPTNAWYGMYYADEVGKRLPVPVFQAIECTIVFLIALRVERYIKEHHGPVGVVTSVTVGLWCLSRFVDEFFWLGHDNGTDAIEIGSLFLFALGTVLAFWLIHRQNARGGGVSEPDPDHEHPVSVGTS